MIPPSVRARPIPPTPVSESRIKRITQITRITPHRPTATSSFPLGKKFGGFGVYRPSPLYRRFIVPIRYVLRNPVAIIRRDRPMCLPIPRPLSYEERGVASFDGLINGCF